MTMTNVFWLVVGMNVGVGVVFVGVARRWTLGHAVVLFDELLRWIETVEQE